MECEEARFGLYALLDNELDIATNLEVLSHLEGCPSCQRELELDARLKTLVREQLSTPAPPPELWGKVMQRIGRETEGERPSWPVLSRLWPRARLFQAAAAAVMVLFALSFFFISLRDGPAVLLDELVKDHLRSVAKESGPADVPLTDPREILAHFRAQVPPSLPVPLIMYEGARLLGGSFCRLGHIKGIRFTYQLGQGETVSLYQLDRSDQVPLPESASGGKYFSRPRGLGIVLWGDGRLLYALVGELAQHDLQRLASHMGSF
jgi:mycothiol system anti-sigma-R factor